MSIQFFFIANGVTLNERKRLKSFIDFIFKSEKRELLSLAYIFCSDDYLLKINKDFLNHDYYTDIITFNLSSSRGRVEGEVYISIDRVKENSLNLNTSFQNELHRVIFHGALHLCGYKDKTTQQQMKMRMAEDKCLGSYFK